MDWLIYVGLFVGIDGALMYHTGDKNAALFAGLGFTASGFGYALEHQVLSGLVGTGFGAHWLYTWWNNGGGTRMKRRLKRIFQPVRRTAPAAG